MDYDILDLLQCEPRGRKVNDKQLFIMLTLHQFKDIDIKLNIWLIYFDHIPIMYAACLMFGDPHPIGMENAWYCSFNFKRMKHKIESIKRGMEDEVVS